MLWKIHLGCGGLVILVVLGIISGGCSPLLPTPVLALTALAAANYQKAAGAEVSPLAPQSTGTEIVDSTAPTKSSFELTPVTPAYWAHGYVRALYAGDDALGRQMAFQHATERFQLERKIKLEDSAVDPLSREQVGDLDPRSERQYFRVKTRVTLGPLHGQGEYLVVLQPVPQARKVLKVEQVAGGIAWQP